MNVVFRIKQLERAVAGRKFILELVVEVSNRTTSILELGKYRNLEDAQNKVVMMKKCIVDAHCELVDGDCNPIDVVMDEVKVIELTDVE